MNENFINVELFGSKQRLARSQGLSLFLLGKLLELSNTVKYLGLIFDVSVDWHERHINSNSNKATRRLNLLGRIRKYLDTCESIFIIFAPSYVFFRAKIALNAVICMI